MVDGTTPADDGDADERETYHHGDLREALLTAAVTAARRGGAEAIVLRELTRRAGVTPRAAYRHFDGVQALVEAVGRVALRELADRILARVGQVDEPDEGAAAVAVLHVIGEEYVSYARCEPGMFDVTFFARRQMADQDALRAVAGGPTAYSLLTDTIAAIDRAGRLTVPAPVGVLACWSAVHGLATLTVRGPLRELPDEQVEQMTVGVVAAAVAGVTRPPG